MSTQWHNPENVSADLLPKGYRFLTTEEFYKNTNGWRSSRRALMWWHDWSGPSVWAGNSDNTYCVPIAAMPAVGSYGRAYQQPGEVLVDAKELAELREEVKKLRAHIKLAQWAESHDMADLREDKARLEAFVKMHETNDARLPGYDSGRWYIPYLVSGAGGSGGGVGMETFPSFNAAIDAARKEAAK